MRNTLNEEKPKERFEASDKEKTEQAVQETLDWLDKNQLAEKDEFEAKQKELEGVVNPIMTKVYQTAGGGGMPGSPDRQQIFELIRTSLLAVQDQAAGLQTSLQATLAHLLSLESRIATLESVIEVLQTKSAKTFSFAAMD